VPVPSKEARGHYLCARGIDFAAFYDFSIEFWNCSNSIVLFFQFVSYSLGIEIISYKLLFIAEYDYHHGY
jgi:hypothetical protein